MSASEGTGSVAAVIIDIVGSRAVADRVAAQKAVRAAFATANDHVAPAVPVWSTVGDEFQVVYASVTDACIATTAVRLALADEYDVRFGIGAGASTVVEVSDRDVPIYDGTAWWNARAAIEEAERRGLKSATARTWACVDGGDDTSVTPALLMRDHVITMMRPRERRIALGLMSGEYQSEIADREHVTQSAISQSARRSGANALVQAVAQWRAVSS